MDTGQHWALCWVTLGNCVWQTKWQRAASRADHSKFAQNSCDDNKSRAGTVSSSLNHFHTRSPGWAGSVWGEMITTAQTQLCRAKTHSRDIVIRAQYTLWSRLPMYLLYTLTHICTENINCDDDHQWWKMCGFESHFVSNSFSSVDLVQQWVRKKFLCPNLYLISMNFSDYVV